MDGYIWGCKRMTALLCNINRDTECKRNTIQRIDWWNRLNLGADEGEQERLFNRW